MLSWQFANSRICFIINVIFAAEYDLYLTSHNIKTAFLYSDLQPDENIYLRRPTGVTDDIIPYIIKFKKNIYMVFGKHRNTLMLIFHSTPRHEFCTDAEMFILERPDEKVILL